MNTVKRIAIIAFVVAWALAILSPALAFGDVAAQADGLASVVAPPSSVDTFFSSALGQAILTAIGGVASAGFLAFTGTEFYKTRTNFVTRRIAEFIAAAVASGQLRVPAGTQPGTLASASYMPPAMPWIDPRKEAEAWGILEDRAYASGPEIIRKRGGNPLDVLEQQGRWLREKAAEGVPPPPTSGQAAAPADAEGV